MSIPSETSILLYCSIFITHTNTHLYKFGDNIYHLQKQMFLYDFLSIFSKFESVFNIDHVIEKSNKFDF